MIVITHKGPNEVCSIGIPGVASIRLKFLRMRDGKAVFALLVPENARISDTGVLDIPQNATSLEEDSANEKSGDRQE